MFFMVIFGPIEHSPGQTRGGGPGGRGRSGGGQDTGGQGRQRGRPERGPPVGEANKGWLFYVFVRENPIKMDDDFGVPPEILGHFHIL